MNLLLSPTVHPKVLACLKIWGCVEFHLIADFLLSFINENGCFLLSPVCWQGLKLLFQAYSCLDVYIHLLHLQTFHFLFFFVKNHIIHLLSGEKESFE